VHQKKKYFQKPGDMNEEEPDCDYDKRTISVVFCDFLQSRFFSDATEFP
jgi:hypothetical protein